MADGQKRRIVMTNEAIKEDDKIILQGRIYPAIQSCVNNRYKIILGLFAYYGYVLSHKEVLCILKEHRGNWICSAILSSFVLHNLINYWFNRKDQMDREPENKKYLKWPWIEISFSATTFILIVVVYLVLVVKFGIW